MLAYQSMSQGHLKLANLGGGAGLGGVDAHFFISYFISSPSPLYIIKVAGYVL